MASCSDGLLMELLHPRELIPGELDEEALLTRCAFLYTLISAGKGRTNQSGVGVTGPGRPLVGFDGRNDQGGQDRWSYS